MINSNNKSISLRIKPRSSKQIVKAGLTLGLGYLVLPFIKFKDARRYEPFKRNQEIKKW